MTITETSPELPVGMAGLQYPITQVSLVVEDIDQLMERYYGAFGWAPWQDFDHVPPVHRNTTYRGESVDYSLRGAEVYVGALNFELLKPLPGGSSIFHEQLEQRGEGIAAIASMFHEKQDGDAVKAAFLEHFGLDVITRAEIGDHIEYYYVDTQAEFGCPIESGSGHALDFHPPARVFPSGSAGPVPSPASGITYQITHVTLVVDHLDHTITNYQRAFGWRPWKIFNLTDSLPQGAQHLGQGATFGGRVAQVGVGELVFEVIEPGDGPSPWKDFQERVGSGIMSIGVTPQGPATVDDAVDQFSAEGIDVLASGRFGEGEWRLLDTQSAYKALISVTSPDAFSGVEPVETRH